MLIRNQQVSGSNPFVGSSSYRERWRPDVRYAGATADRITPRDEDFQSLRSYQASPSIIKAANEIFETERFTLLRTINLTRGNKNQALLLFSGSMWRGAGHSHS